MYDNPAETVLQQLAPVCLLQIYQMFSVRGFILNVVNRAEPSLRDQGSIYFNGLGAHVGTYRTFTAQVLFLKQEYHVLICVNDMVHMFGPPQ